MKVVKKGNTTPWWVGRQGQCWKCKAVVEFERGDQPEVYTAKDQRDNDAAKLSCPTEGCGEVIAVTPGTWV